MNHLIEFLGGPDGFVAFFTFIGSVVRAAQGNRVLALEGLMATFTTFFVVYCLLVLIHYCISLTGLTVPPIPLGASGGIFGYLGNYWLAGLQRNGRFVAKGGAAQAMLKIIKAIGQLKN